MRRPQFAVRPRTLLTAMFAIVVVAALVVGYLVVHGRPQGRVKLVDLPEESTATVGLAGAFPGAGEEALRNPLGIAWDGKTLFVAESDAQRVRLFDPSGGRLGEIRLAPAKGKTSSYPSAIASVDGGRLVIVDNAGPRVVVVSAEPASSAKVLFTLGGGKGPGQPTSVAYADGEFFVFDAGVSGVLVYDTKGKLLRTIGVDLEPKVAFATGMCVDGGSLYLTDTNGGRVMAIDKTSGKQALLFPDRYALPRSITVLDSGYLAVTDAFDQAVYVTTLEGERRDTIDAANMPEGALTSPRGLAWLADTKRLYVSDAVSGIIAVYNVRLDK